MASIVIPSQRNRQPTQAARVSHGAIAAGCVFACIPALGPVDLVSGGLLTFTGSLTPRFKPTVNGIGLGESVSGTPSWSKVIGLSNVYSVMAFGCYTAGFSGTLIDGKDSSSNDALLFRDWDFLQFLPWNTSSGLGSVAKVAGQTSTQTRDGALTGGSTDANGNITIWCGSAKSTGSNSPLRNLHSINIYFSTAGSGAWAQHLIAVWNRPLLDAEWLSLASNPWQLFAPAQRRIYFSTGAGGALSVTPSGIATAEAFGTARLDHGLTLTAIGSAEAFGTPVLTLGQTISAAGAIASAQAFGTARFDLGIALSGVTSGEAFGTARLDFNLVATGITTAGAFGSATVNLDAGQSITVTGIGSAEGFGTAGLVQSGVIATAAIASAEAFGTARLDFRLVLSGAASAEAFGTAQVALDTSQTVSAVGAIATAEAFGTERLDFSLLLTGLASAGAFGAAVVQGGVQDAFGETRPGSVVFSTDRRIGYSPLADGKRIGVATLTPDDGKIS